MSIVSCPRSSWFDRVLLPVWARIRPNAVSPCCILSSWPHIAGTTAHPHTRTGRPVVLGRRLAPSALPASCSLPRCTLHTPYSTTHHIASSVGAPVRPCATNSFFPDVSLSPRLGCGAHSRALPMPAMTGSTGHDQVDRCRQCCSRLVQSPGGEAGQGFLKQRNTLRSGIANGNEATLCIVYCALPASCQVRGPRQGPQRIDQRLTAAWDRPVWRSSTEHWFAGAVAAITVTIASQVCQSFEEYGQNTRQALWQSASLALVTGAGQGKGRAAQGRDEGSLLQMPSMRLGWLRSQRSAVDTSQRPIHVHDLRAELGKPACTDARLATKA